MKERAIEKRIVPAAAVVVLLLLFSAGAARADELSDLKQQMDTTTKMLQEMQERMAQLEARQRLKEQSMAEQIEAVVKKTEDIEKAAPAGLPTSASWVERIKWSGDLRYRHEHLDQETTSSGRWNPSRDRHRIRARLMLEAVVNDEWGVGFRLATGSSGKGGDFEGDPVSTNQDLGNSFSSKNIWLDLAYFDYHPLAVEGLNVYGGKIKNPFYRVGDNQLIFDGDLNPEGIAFTWQKPLNDRDTLRLAGGGFWVDESSGSATDPSLFGAQAMITRTIGNPDKATAGVSYYSFGGIKGHAGLPAQWSSSSSFMGNSNSGGVYTSDYDVFEAFGEYATECHGTPLSFFGNWIKNIAATSSEDTGWLIGTKINKAKDPGSWEASYMYENIEADATFGAINDSDFIGGGTDGKGHIFDLTYQVSKNVQTALTYFLNKDTADNSDYRRLHAALFIKFK